MGRLSPTDPLLPVIELAMENDDPTLTSAVVRKVLAEVQHERGARIAQEPNRAGDPSS